MVQLHQYFGDKLEILRLIKCYWKRLLCTVGAAFLLLPAIAQLPGNAQLFNGGWSFHRGDIDSTGGIANISGNAWKAVTLPHDWSIDGPFSPKWASATGYLPGGIGWYKKSFQLDKGNRLGSYFIYFGAIYKNSKVWLNGHLLGERPSGFVSFYYDLTPYLHKNGRNELLVKVDHADFADSRWYTGSGIYRSVYLVNLPEVHIPIWGVHVETGSINNERATLKVHADIVNNAMNKASKNSITISQQLIDSKGNQVTLATQSLRDGGKVIGSNNRDASESMAKNKGSVFGTDITLTITKPRLWSVKDPYLYTLVTRLIKDGKLLQTYRTSVGIREIQFNADKGFFLNGKNLQLKGVCIHDDGGSFGVAVPMAIWKERLQLLKEAGCNAIRMTHNPHAGELYDLCDQMGFLVIDESFDEWELGKHKWITGWNNGAPGTDGYHAAFAKWWKRDLTAMIQRDRNHPSIIMWSIGNEIDYPNDPYSDPVLNEGHYPQIYGSGYIKTHPDAKALAPIAHALATLTRSLDKTRPVTAGLAAVMVADKVGYTDALDVAGYNYQEYRYEEDHAKFPKRIIYGSENGHGYSAWKAVTDHPFVMGQFLWTGVDYLGEASKWPSHGNEAGLINMANFKKPEFYFRQSIWSDHPVVYLGTSKAYHRLNLKNGRHGMARPNWNYAPGDTINVYCYTNCASAILLLNGVSLGSQQQNDSTHVILWQVPYAAGKLEVHCTDGKGQVYKDQIQTFGAPSQLALRYHALDSTEGTSGIYAIDVQVVDKAGQVVLTDSSDIQVAMLKGSRLIGMENGNVRDTQPYGGEHRRVYQGRLRLYVQVTQPHKSIQLRLNGTTNKGVPLATEPLYIKL